jgi:hypothetical protein
VRREEEPKLVQIEALYDNYFGRVTPLSERAAEKQALETLWNLASDEAVRAEAALKYFDGESEQSRQVLHVSPWDQECVDLVASYASYGTEST